MKILSQIYKESMLVKLTGLAIIAMLVVGLLDIKLLDNATTMIVLGTLGSIITLNIIVTKLVVKYKGRELSRNAYFSRSKRKIKMQALLAINLLIIHTLMAIVVVYFTPVAVIRQALTFVFAVLVFVYLSKQLKK